LGDWEAERLVEPEPEPVPAEAEAETETVRAEAVEAETVEAEAETVEAETVEAEAVEAGECGEVEGGDKGRESEPRGAAFPLVRARGWWGCGPGRREGGEGGMCVGEWRVVSGEQEGVRASVEG
jgi:hypothetical protein